MFKSLLFKKNCRLCEYQLDLDVCLICNGFINLCKSCSDSLIVNYFVNEDNNPLFIQNKNSYYFIKMNSKTEYNLFCNKCFHYGLYGTNGTNIENKYLQKFQHLFNLYFKRHKSF